MNTHWLQEARRSSPLGMGVATVGAGLATVGALTLTWRRLSPHLRYAPGWPGDKPHWYFAAKDGVGTALGSPGPARSRVWFTLQQGILSEVFYPRVDQPAIRQLGLIVTDGRGFFSEEPRGIQRQVETLAEGSPAYRLTNTCRQGRYRVEKTTLIHPDHDVVLQQVRFNSLRGALEDYRLYALLDPYLSNRGRPNNAWIDSFAGQSMLFAEHQGHALALACSSGWLESSAGFVGRSDGRRDLQRHGHLTQTYGRAFQGNVSLIGEVELRGSEGVFLLALGFGESPAEAAHHARAGLLDDFGATLDRYNSEWRDWQASLSIPEPSEPGGRDLYRTSTMVLRSHEDKDVPGAFVASLTIPWGQALTEKQVSRIGYHVVWPRDLAMIAGGLLAAGASQDASRALDFFRATQLDDGHWPQNLRVSGQPLWEGHQLGETALPILLLDLLSREGALGPEDRARCWPMVRAAASHLLRSGPSAQEDRWEDEQGFTPFTHSSMIAALLIAAEMADEQGEGQAATFLRETADIWHATIDFWTYVEGTKLARRVGVEGYYLRIAPPDNRGEPTKYKGDLKLWYRPRVKDQYAPEEIVSPDALAYVRFGLRAPDDPRIINTLKVIDAILKVETPFGPVWHRYNHDGYGEKIGGEPFDGKQGHGRAWPLLTGERAHYELAAGRPEEAARLLRTMEAFAGDGGLLPEQVWDTYDIPEKGLFFGRPTGSAMPLAWAHAEYLKLRRSLRNGRVFDMPPQTVQRYQVERVQSLRVLWRLDHRRRSMPAGRILRLEFQEPAVIHWSADGGSDGREVSTRNSNLGIHHADLPTEGLPSGSKVHFTISWADRIRLDKRGLLALKPHSIAVE